MKLSVRNRIKVRAAKRTPIAGVPGKRKTASNDIAAQFCDRAAETIFKMKGAERKRTAPALTSLCRSGEPEPRLKPEAFLSRVHRQRRH